MSTDDAAEARLAAVHALPEQWEAQATPKSTLGYFEGYDDAKHRLAYELRAALDGETP